MGARLRTVVALALLALLAAGPAWALKPGEKAPEFTCQAAEGTPITSADFTGKAAAICCWASWSKGSLEELKYLQSLLGEFKGKNLAVVALNQREDRAKVTAFAAKHQLTLRLGLDDGKVARTLDVNGLPNLLIVDSAGVVRARFVGYGPTLAARIKKALAPLLAEPKATTKPEKPPTSTSPDLPASLRAYSHLQLGAAHINIGDAFISAGYSDAGHYAEAVREMKAGLAIDPKHVDLMVWLGVAYERRGDKTEALKQYQAALAVDPESSYAKDGLRRLKGLPPAPPPPPPTTEGAGE
jgi:peroxiredoxin